MFIRSFALIHTNIYLDDKKLSRQGVVNTYNFQAFIWVVATLCTGSGLTIQPRVKQGLVDSRTE